MRGTKIKTRKNDYEYYRRASRNKNKITQSRQIMQNIMKDICSPYRLEENELPIVLLSLITHLPCYPKHTDINVCSCLFELDTE